MIQATVDRAAASPPRPESLSLAAAGLLYLVLTLAATWPLSRHPGSLAFSLGADSNLVLWILAWDAHAFLHQPFSLFEANIYYPEPHTLAFAENLIGSALIAAPVIWVSGNVVLGLSVVTILSCALCGLGAYFLARRVGVGVLGALLTGSIFAFAPPRFGRLSQPHLNAVQWLPFALASLHGYLDNGRRRDLWLALAFFSLQVLSSGHGAVYAAVSVAALLVYRAAMGEQVAAWRRLRDVGLVGLVLILPSFLVMLPYRAVSHELGLHRTLPPDWAPISLNFLSSGTHFHQFLISLVPSLHINERADGVLFMGILPMVLAAVALWPRIRRSGARSGFGLPPVARASVEEWMGAAATGRPASGGARRLARSDRAWRGLALALDLVVLAALAVAIYRSSAGPFKIRWNRQVLLSVVVAWRPWLFGVGMIALRAWMGRRIAFDPLRWLRPPFRAAWRALSALPSAFPRLVPALERWRAAHRRSAVLFYGLLGLGSLMLAAPPPLGIWPHVYWLPGFNFVRVPARFTIITLLALAVLAGLGFDRACARLRPRWRRALGIAAMLFLALEYATVPLDPEPFRIDVPAIDRWLDTLPKPFAIAEVPLPYPQSNRYEKQQSLYMLHSTGHWQRTVHAFSGFRTSRHEALFDAMQRFPDEASLRALAEIKVDYVVVHSDYYDAGEWKKVEARIAGFPDQLRLVHAEGPGRVYALARR